MNYEPVVVGITNKSTSTQEGSVADVKANEDKPVQVFILVEKWKVGSAVTPTVEGNKSSQDDVTSHEVLKESEKVDKEGPQI